MLYGICAKTDLAPAAKDAGFDFLEGTVADLFCPREDETAFESIKTAVAACGLPFPAANVFVPGNLPIVGPSVNPDALDTHVATVMKRAEALGTGIIVFGSGGARNVPSSFDRRDAWKQLLAFSRMAAGHAARHGVTVVLEPLNRQECNILNSVGECSQLVREVDHPHFRVLVDSYHWWLDDNSAEDVLAARDILAHVHVATVPNRLPPGGEDSAFIHFFSILQQAGYDGRVSIEAKGEKDPASLALAVQTLRAAAANAGSAHG